jgi:hypothetical protein
LLQLKNAAAIPKFLALIPLPLSSRNPTPPTL